MSLDLHSVIQLIAPRAKEVRLVVGGITGNGKSTLLNGLAKVLGHAGQHFTVAAGPSSVTAGPVTKRFPCSVAGSHVDFVFTDEAGYLDSQGRDATLLRQMVLNNRGTTYHAVLYTIPIRKRFDGSEQAVMDIVRTVFGADVFQYVIVCLTHADILSEQDLVNLKSLWQSTLQQFLGHRVSVVCTGIGKDDSFVQVLGEVATIVNTRPGAFEPPQVPQVVQHVHRGGPSNEFEKVGQFVKRDCCIM